MHGTGIGAQETRSSRAGGYGLRMKGVVAAGIIPAGLEKGVETGELAGL